MKKLVPDCGVAGNFALVESPLGKNLAGGGEHTLHKVVVELHPEQWDLTEVAVNYNIYIPGSRFASENVQK
jgi:hypothetical protein